MWMGQPPPALAPYAAPPPPANPEVGAAIERLAAYTARNGPEFETMIMKEHRYNPEFRFLFERSSSDYQYYHWLVEQHKYRHNPAPVSTLPWPPSQPVIAAPAARIPVVFSAEKWSSIVSAIDVSKQSVKGASDWLFCCQISPEFCTDSIAIINSRMMSFGFEPEEFPSKLALLYLINEILHRVKCEAEASPILTECCRHLGAILQRVYALNSPSNQAQVESVIELWRQRGILPPATCDVLRAQMMMEVTPPKRNRDKIQPPEYKPDLPELPPNTLLASSFIVLPSEVVEACRGAAPYTTLNQLQFSALARRTHLGSGRDYETEREILNDFYDDLEKDDGEKERKVKERKYSESRRSSERYRRRSSRYDDRYYSRSRSVSVESAHGRASRSRSWSRGRSPTPDRR